MLRSCAGDSDDKAQRKREEGCGVHGGVMTGLIQVFTASVSRFIFSLQA